ncbi:N-acyl homoserine lactonase family protein [Salinisphaera sp. T31B1]|uniref:N-acyl homoserine lactonase family protein n=1 Tax=Salinisphaera sp. T31B1 TaxID=727963 RepID=UPI0033415740
MPTDQSPATERREIIAVRYGTRDTLRSEIYYNFEAFGEPDAPAVMDYYFWVVRDARQTWVIDTGFSAAAGAARDRTMLVTPADALRRLQIDPATVGQLVITHAHYDHTGNIDLFSNAEIVMSQTEYDFIAGPFADRGPLAVAMDADDNRRLLALADAGRVKRVGTTHSLAPGLQLLEMPGHTPGQLSLVVAQPEGPVVLSSDAVHYYEELECDRPFAVMSGLLDMYRSFAAIRELLTAPGAVLVPGHDPEVMTRFAPVDPSDPGFAVCIA